MATLDNHQGTEPLPEGGVSKSSPHVDEFGVGLARARAAVIASILRKFGVTG